MRRLYFLLALMLFMTSIYAQHASKKGNVSANQISVQKKAQSVVKNSDAIFSEDFESGNLDNWTLLDKDGDKHNWIIGKGLKAHAGTAYAASASWDETAGALTPENWLVSKAIDLSAASGTIFLDYYVAPIDQDWPSEKYKCVLSTTGSDVTDFTTNLYEEVIIVGPNNGYTKRSIDISSYIGETIYLAWVHYDCSDNYLIGIDDISVYKNTTVDVGIVEVKTPTNENGCTLTASEDITVTLFNYGGETVSKLSVGLSINGGEQVSETTINLDLKPGKSKDYTFTNKADLLTLDYYSLNLSVTLKDDINQSNDSLMHKVTSGDAKITVRTLSDGNNDEIWVIKNLAGDVIAKGPDYQWNVKDTIDICVIANDCYTFEFTGFDKTGWLELLYNDVVVAGGQIPGNTIDGVTFYGIGEACPDEDMRLTSISLPNLSEPSELDIKGALVNYGKNTLTSFDVVYEIGDHISAIYSVTGINVLTSGKYEFTHDIPYNFNTIGNYTVKVTISNPNGVPDENPADNVLSSKIIIATSLLEKKQLFEHFTSSTCGPCATYTPTADKIQAANPDKYSLIRYQVSWPGTGDPYKTAMAADRVKYYSPSGVPSVYRNGKYDMNISQASFNTYATQPSIFSINIDAQYEGNNVTVAATIGTIANIDAGVTAHIVVVENKTVKNIGTNGEKEWLNVMMAMLPTSAGTILKAIAKDESVTVTETYNMSTTFVEEMNDLTAVVFIQDETTKEVLQSEMVAINSVGIKDVNSNSFNVYPNPFNNTLTIDHLENASQVIVSNILGQTVKTVNKLGSKVVISTDDLNKGIYFISVIDNNNNIKTEKVVKQ